MANTIYNSTEDMINKLQSLKGKTKLNFYKKITNYFDIMNIRMDEGPFARNAQGISKIYLELIILMKLQTKPEVKIMNLEYYVLYYTVKNRDEKENVNDKYNENDYINFDDFIVPNHNISIKPGGTIVM